RAEWDEIVFDRRVLLRASTLVPLVVLQAGLRFVPGISPLVLDLALRLLSAAFILAGALILDAALSAGHALYQRLRLADRRHIKCYGRLAKNYHFALPMANAVYGLVVRPAVYNVRSMCARFAITLPVVRNTSEAIVESKRIIDNALVRMCVWSETQ